MLRRCQDNKQFTAITAYYLLNLVVLDLEFPFIYFFHLWFWKKSFKSLYKALQQFLSKSGGKTLFKCIKSVFVFWIWSSRSSSSSFFAITGMFGESAFARVAGSVEASIMWFPFRDTWPTSMEPPAEVVAAGGLDNFGNRIWNWCLTMWRSLWSHF